VISDPCQHDLVISNSERWERGVHIDDLYDHPLKVVSVGMSRWGWGQFFERSVCRFHALELVTAGNATFSQNGADYLVEAGEVFCLRKSCRHIYRTGPAGFLHKRYIQIEGAALSAMLAATNLTIADHVKLSQPTMVTRLFREITQLVMSKPAGFQLQASEKVYRLLIELGRETHPPCPVAIQRALDFMEQNIDGNPTLADIAATAGLSATHFTRLFRSHRQMSPIAWFIQRKMDLAKHMLMETTLSIKEIAAAVGFSDPLYFSAQFKKHVGVAPKFYVDQAREES
jgi:AraC-like DNA-binding protein